MTQKAILLSALALFCLALLTSAPASSAGRPCAVDHGACFFTFGDQLVLVLFDEPTDDDNDGDVDYILIFADGHNDWVRQNPDGSSSIHLQSRSHDVVYCPFYLFDVFPPTDECVFGTGRTVSNAVFDGPLGFCPGALHLRNATGVRPADDAVFNFEAEFQVTASDCENIQKFSITAEEVD